MKLILVDGKYYVSGMVLDPESGARIRVRRSTGCGKGQKREAESLMASVVEKAVREWREKSLSAGYRASEGRPLVYVRDAVRAYWRMRENNKGGVGRDGSYLKRFEKEFGKRKLSDLRGHEVLGVIEEREIASASMRREAVVVRAVMQFAGSRGAAVDFKYEKLPREGEGRSRWLTIGQRDRFLDAMYDRDRELWRLATVLFETGGRLGCVRNLTWRDVGETSVGLTSRKGDGTLRHYRVPMTDVCERALKHWPGSRGPDAPVFVEFCSPDFEVNNDFYGRWKEACRVVGLEDFRPHDCRHTYATLLARSGEVDLGQLRDLLGHADVSMTLRYAHHMPVREAGVSLALRGKDEADRRGLRGHRASMSRMVGRGDAERAEGEPDFGGESGGDGGEIDRDSAEWWNFCGISVH